MTATALPDASRPPAPEPAEPRRVPTWLPGAIGLLGVLAVWVVASTLVFNSTTTVPTPWAVVHRIAADWSNGTLPKNVAVTLKEAAWGYLFGNAVAIALALVVVLIPFLERTVLQVTLIIYSMPIIALGPVLDAAFRGQRAKVALAAISVVFTTLVGATVGLRSADPRSLDVVRGVGGGTWAMLTKVRLRSALPYLLAALRIAAPAALLGAILGEYLGGQDTGIGIAMISAQQKIEPDRLWGLGFVCVAVAGVGYACTAMAARFITPWAPRLDELQQ